MARRPTDSEWATLHRWFPRESRANIYILGEQTTRYNCLAWTLGYTDRWVWPWGSRNATLAEMTAFVRQYALVPGSPAAAAAYGASTVNVGHASRFYVSSPTSKLGGAWLITHTWAGLAGGVYGNYLQSYRKTAALEMVDEIATEEVEIAPDDPKLPRLSSLEMNRLSERAEKVPADLRAQFEEAYSAWQATWLSDPAVFNSAGMALTHTVEFLRLVNQPPETLPLLMEKLSDPDHHFAIKVVERVLPMELVHTLEPDDPDVLEGEQFRARLIVSNWLASD